MPDYTWLRNRQFRDEIDEYIRLNAGSFGIKTYHISIADLLFKYAQDNADDVILTESVKTASLQRGQQDAINSLAVLLIEACNIAQMEKRSELTESDMDAAYKKKFCRVWPFCNGTNG